LEKLKAVLTNAQKFIWEWANRTGGINFDYSFPVTTDGSGNVYTTVSFSGSVYFDPDSLGIIKVLGEILSIEKFRQ
jgi:hypothetical protein